MLTRILTMVGRNFWRVPGAWFKLCHYAKHTDEYSEIEKYSHIRFIMEMAVKSGNIDMTVTGIENLPKENGYLLYGNHQGMFDIVAIVAAFPGPLAAVFKKELADVQFLKQVIACTKSFAMDREDPKQSLRVIQAVTKEVQEGRNYLIFPEGTRSKMGNKMGDFHGGSFRCAVKAQCPVVPVALIDCFKPFDEKGTDTIPIQLHFLNPIPYEEYKDLKTVELAALVKGRIQEVLDKYAN